ncbi:MAG: hypothetical protein F6K10_35095, partial [Moorea sp. SIO2B7]|nr:hypothetical protein [Moorena sp. SIO2B7]
CHFLDPKVKLQLLGEQKNIAKIPDGFSDVFLLTPYQGLQEKVKKNKTLKLEEISYKEGQELQLYQLKQ